MEAILIGKFETRGATVCNCSILPIFVDSAGKITSVDATSMFAGLAITRPDSPFQIGQSQFSVIKLDFSKVEVAYFTLDQINLNICTFLIDMATKLHHIDLRAHLHPHQLLMQGAIIDCWVDILVQLFPDKKIVILLIDEYDSPMTSLLLAPSFRGQSGPQRAEGVAQYCSGVYKNIKEMATRINTPIHKVANDCLLLMLCKFSIFNFPQK